MRPGSPKIRLEPGPGLGFSLGRHGGTRSEFQTAVAYLLSRVPGGFYARSGPGTRAGQLNRLDWRNYLQAKNPAATALMARMRIEPKDRIKVKAQVLRLILTMRLSRPKMTLIASFVDRYLALTAEEDLAMRRELAKVLPMKLKEEASELMTSWERRGLAQGLEKGLEKGREEGRREERMAIVRNQLERQFGRLPQATIRRISRLSGAQLQRLAIALLDFGSIADLRSWLTAVAGSARRAA